MFTKTRPTGENQTFEARRDIEILRITAAISSAVTMIYAVTGIAIGDGALMMRAIGPALMAAFALWQLTRKPPRSDLMLLVAAIFVAIQVKIIEQPEIETAATLGLLMIGAAGSVVIRAKRGWYLASYSALLMATQLWWFDESPGTEAVLVGSVIPVVAFLFIARLMLWVRTGREMEEARYKLLFQRAPVPIFEQDMTAAGRWLADLRRRGVADLRRYLDQHPEALHSAVGKIIVRNANDAAFAYLEAESREQVLGPLQPEVITADTLRSAKEQLLAIWEDRDSLDDAVKGMTMNGSEIDGLLGWAVPREKGRLDLANSLVTVADITELRKVERRLREMVRSKDEFIASVSHELRTPLTAVVGLASELHQNLESFGAAERQEFIDLIVEQAIDVANIVEDLLVAARAGIGTVAVAAAKLNITDTVRTVVDINANGTRFEVEGPTEGDLHAVADEARVRQILRNLLSNANRYGGSTVVVRAGRTHQTAWIEVADDGPGIKPDERERIFEPYATAHPVTGVTAAVGLGLTVSRQLAELMAGNLTYRYENGESVFRLSLPAAN